MESTDYIRDMRDLVPGATIVHLAVENRDIEKINNASKDLLIRCDRDGESPLHYAAVNDDLEDGERMILLANDIGPKEDVADALKSLTRYISID